MTLTPPPPVTHCHTFLDPSLSLERDIQLWTVPIQCVVHEGAFWRESVISLGDYNIISQTDH